MRAKAPGLLLCSNISLLLNDTEWEE